LLILVASVTGEIRRGKKILAVPSLWQTQI